MGKIVAALDIGGTSIKSGLWNGSELLRTEEWDTNAKNGGICEAISPLMRLESVPPVRWIRLADAFAMRMKTFPDIQEWKYERF